MLVDFELTDEHIEKGIRGKCLWCPFALCIDEKLDEKYKSEVMRSLCRITINDGHAFPSHGSDLAIVNLPIEVTRMILAIDHCIGSEISPMKFQLDIPEQFLKQAA